ncbi:MAG TPA: T9SS type A sorting domain-containing protein [bacterium]|jgi:Zn-dependent metalloprotease
MKRRILTGHFSSKALFVTIAMLLLSTSLAWAVQWPAERDVQDLTRTPQSGQLNQTPFANWSVFWSTGLNMPALAYGPPANLTSQNPASVLRLVTAAAETDAHFDLIRTKTTGRLTRHYFREMRDGLPVLAGRADLVINARGQLMRWSLRAHDRWPSKGRHDLSLPTAASALSATRPSADWQLDASRSFAAWFPDYDTHTLRPAYWVHIQGARPDERWEGVVDATSGEIIMDWPGIQTDVLSGTMSGAYWQPYIQSDVQTGPFPYENIYVNADSVYSSSTGTFSIEAGNAAQLSTGLNGRYVYVMNDAGEAGHLSQNLTAPYSPLAWTWGENDATHAELNLYHHVNFVHDWYKVLDPGFSDLDYPVPTIANYGINYDNAFWGGNGMAFGTGSMYLNFAMFSDVIYHEFSHGVTGSIYDGVDFPYAGQTGAMNEGWSDYIGCTINGDPYMGDWIGGSFASYFRNLLSTMVFPRDWQGEVHADSPFISASLWSIREQLGTQIGDSLAHFARYGLATTFVDYMIAVLETDDNDGDLSNGTPHSRVIYDAFNAHGIGSGDDPVLAIHDLAYYANGQGGSHGDGDRFFEQGETIELVFNVSNDAILYPPPATGVQIVVHTTDQSLSMDNATQTIDTLAASHGHAVAPIHLALTADGPNRWVVIQIDVSANGGTATLHQEFEFQVGTPRVLIVQNDQSSDVESFVRAAMRDHQNIYDSVSVAAGQSIQASILPQPGMVIWLSGNASGNILTPTDQTILQSYLAAGNRVVLSGQNIVDSLGATDFMENVLHVQINDPSMRTLAATGTQAPFSHGEWFLLSGGYGANNQTEQTSFTVPDSARIVTSYGRTAGGQTAGVSFAEGKGLLFGFGIEAVSGMAAGSTDLPGLLDNLQAWAVDVLPAEPAVHRMALPTVWSIGPAYPNPFNGTANISYSIPSPMGGDLRIFDLMGREVEHRHLGVGTGTVAWQPHTATGIYFAQVAWSGGQTKPVKLMYLK